MELRPRPSGRIHTVKSTKPTPDGRWLTYRMLCGVVYHESRLTPNFPPAGKRCQRCQAVKET